MADPAGSKLLKRPERRRTLLDAAARVFARTGYAAATIEEIAREAGVSRVLLYRHFDSKTDLYEAVLTEVSDQLRKATGHPDHTNAGSLQGLITAAADNPDGFRLFFRHSGQEPEWRRHADELREAMRDTAEPYLRQTIDNPDRLRWAAALVPAIAVEAVIAWLDAGRPDSGTAADTIGRLIAAAVTAISSPVIDGPADHPSSS